jgi:Protein of unknown function (DUF2637)
MVSGGAVLGRDWCRMMAADRVVRRSTAGAVVGVAAVAAVRSYEHAYNLVRARGEPGWMPQLAPATVDGLIYASSMVTLDSASSFRFAAHGAFVPIVSNTFSSH